MWFAVNKFLIILTAFKDVLTVYATCHYMVYSCTARLSGLSRHVDKFYFHGKDTKYFFISLS